MNANTMIMIIIVDLWIAMLTQDLFVLTYGTRSPWRSGFVGRALFVKGAVLGALLTKTVVDYYWTYAYQLEITALLMTALAFACTYQLCALWHQLWNDRRARLAAKP